MRRRTFCSRLLLLIAFFCGAPALSPAAGSELTVFAAASLTDVMKELGQEFERATGTKVVFNFGASSTLARQIREHAPADLFASADEAKMDDLESRHLLLEGTRRDLLSNTLVIVLPAGSSQTLESAAGLVDPRYRVIAIAEPQTVPAGIYARSYLQDAGLWKKLIDRLVPTENVRAALAAVEAGNADAAIVYATDAAISKRVKVGYAIPREEGPPIRYPFAVLKESVHQAEARALLDFLRSESSRGRFRSFGFIVLE
jgi:molybdate transport system substrate-binding protein